MLLVVIDLQERLARHIAGIDEIVKNSLKLIRACKVLGIPVLVTEQIRLGETLNEIKELLDAKPIRKSTFSCLKCNDFYREFKKINAKKVVLIGIEAHICVLQTALDMIKECEVYVAVDCIGSRRPYDKDIAIMRMIQEGIKVCTAESFIYEILKSAEHEKFKEILEIVKEV